MLRHPTYSLVSSFIFLSFVGVLVFLELHTLSLNLLMIIAPVLVIWVGLSFNKYLKSTRRGNFFSHDKDTDLFI